MDEFEKNNDLNNLMLGEYFAKTLNKTTPGLRKIIKLAIDKGIAVPALMESLAYFDGYRTEKSPANLIQGQRDYFEAIPIKE